MMPCRLAYWPVRIEARFGEHSGVVWNALAPELWRRTTIALQRALARLVGVVTGKVLQTKWKTLKPGEVTFEVSNDGGTTHAGAEVKPYFDPLLVKLTARGNDHRQGWL